MTKTRSPYPRAFRHAVEVYLRDVQTHLRLRDWTVTMDWTQNAPDDAYACIIPTPNSKHAAVRLHPQFLTLSCADQRQTLIHELMHAHLFPTHHLAVMMLEETVRKPATIRVACMALEAEVEQVVDALADAFAVMCPPVPWRESEWGSSTSSRTMSSPRRPTTR